MNKQVQIESTDSSENIADEKLEDVIQSSKSVYDGIDISERDVFLEKRVKPDKVVNSGILSKYNQFLDRFGFDNTNEEIDKVTRENILQTIDSEVSGNYVNALDMRNRTRVANLEEIRDIGNKYFILLDSQNEPYKSVLCETEYTVGIDVSDIDIDADEVILYRGTNEDRATEIRDNIKNSDEKEIKYTDNLKLHSKKYSDHSIFDKPVFLGFMTFTFAVLSLFSSLFLFLYLFTVFHFIDNFFKTQLNKNEDEKYQYAVEKSNAKNASVNDIKRSVRDNMDTIKSTTLNFDIQDDVISAKSDEGIKWLFFKNDEYAPTELVELMNEIGVENIRENNVPIKIKRTTFTDNKNIPSRLKSINGDWYIVPE